MNEVGALSSLTGTNAPLRLTEQLAALSEPLRLRVCRLLERHELSVGEVAKVVQVPQSTLSRHLKMLGGAGWIQRRTEGTATLYRLSPDEFGPELSTLWAAIRMTLADDDQHRTDMDRMHRVLAERRPDTLSYFGRIAGQWDAMRQDLFGHGLTGAALMALLPPHWTVADLGCGTGQASAMLAPFVAEVVAIDQSEPMLDAARTRLSAWSNVRFVQAPLEALPLPAGSVDAAVCLLVLHHVANPVEALREAGRIVRPDGRLLIVDMVAHDRHAYRQAMGHMHLGFSATRLAELFLTAGLGAPRVTVLPANPDARGPGLFVADGTV